MVKFPPNRERLSKRRNFKLPIVVLEGFSPKSSYYDLVMMFARGNLKGYMKIVNA